MRLVMASVPVVLGTAMLLQRLSLWRSTMLKGINLQASTLSAAVLVTIVLSACGSGASTQQMATTPGSAEPTPESAAPSEPSSFGHSHDPNMLQIVEQACPTGEFHQSCLDAVRGAAIAGALIAICVWPDGKYALTTPMRGDAAGSMCGETPGGTVAAIVQT